MKLTPAIRCKTRSDYRCAVRAVIDRYLGSPIATARPVPFLAPPGDASALVGLIAENRSVIDFPMMAQALTSPQPHCSADVSAPPSGPPQPVTGALVACTSPAFADSAALLAHTTGRHFMIVEPDDDLAAIANGLPPGTSLLCVGALDDIGTQRVRQLSECATSRPIGVLVAHSEASLSQMVAWRLLRQTSRASDSAHLLLVSDLQLSEMFRDEDTACSYAPEFTAPDPDKPLGLFAFTGHGASIHVDLGPQHVLCGKRKNAQAPGASAFPAAAPNACESQALCIAPSEKRLIPISDVPATVFFAQTCMGISLGDPFHSPNLSLPIGSIECGALGYLSTVKVVGGRPFYPVLMSRALREGFTLGECAQLVARVHVDACREPAGHLLIGDPDVRLGERTHAPWTLRRCEMQAEAGVDIEIDVSSDDTLHLCELPPPAPGSGARASDFRLSVAELTASDGSALPEPYVELVASKDRLALVCIAKAPCRGAQLRVSLHGDAQPSSNVLQLAARIGANVASLRTLGAHLDEQNNARPVEGRIALRDALRQLGEQADALQPALRGLLHDMHPVNSIALANCRLARAELESIRRQIADAANAAMRGAACWRHDDYFPSMFEPAFITDNETHSELPCPSCGARTDLTLRASLFYPGARRKSWHCPRCQQVLDRPADGVDIRISTPKNALAGATLSIRISAYNPLDIAASASGQIRVHNKEGGALLTSQAFEPLTLELAPLERHTIDVPVRIDDSAMPGHHRITFLYISEFGIAAANCCLHVGHGHTTRPRELLAVHDGQRISTERQRGF